MHETLGVLLLASCLYIIVANRVYVHPFYLFSYDNFSCEINQAQVQQSPEMVTLAPIEPHGTVEPDVLAYKEAEGPKQVVNQQIAVLAELQNTLGLRLYHALRQQKTANTLFSPINTFGALVTFYLGAANVTASSLQQFLGLGIDSDKEDCIALFDGHKVLRTLQNINSLIDGTTDELRTLVWTFVNSNVDLGQDFVQGTHDFSDASYIRSVDFSQTEKAKGQVNSFIQRTSSGKIKQLFKRISPSSDLLFASSVHFKGRWKTAFQPEATSMQEFWIDNETNVTVPLMTHVGDYKYLNDKVGRCIIVKLPMSEKAYMLLVLPHEGTSLDHIEAQLTTELMSKWHQHLKEGFLEVSLPKFSMSAVSDLKAILSDMKLSDLLGEGADFGRLSSKDHFTINKVLNKVVFEMSEEGSAHQAKAQDGRVPIKLTVNRPFFFAIVEGNSDAILLLGRITNPMH